MTSRERIGIIGLGVMGELICQYRARRRGLRGSSSDRRGLDLPAVGSPIADGDVIDSWEVLVLRLKVSGMTCDGCARSVKRAIARVSPEAKVEVDLAGGEVRIEGAVAREAAASAITTAGFAVEGQG